MDTSQSSAAEARRVAGIPARRLSNKIVRKRESKSEGGSAWVTATMYTYYWYCYAGTTTPRRYPDQRESGARHSRSPFKVRPVSRSGSLLG